MSGPEQRPFRFGALLGRPHDAQSWLTEVKQADELGFDVVLAGDHLGSGFAALPALVAAASASARLRFGTYVMDNDYRHPAVLAMDAATTDQLTGGRLELGVGAGWRTSEYVAAGLPFDPPLVRTRRMCEAIQIIRALHGPQPVDYSGEFYSLSGLDGQPKPVQRPVPILIAGGGRVLLQFAARTADIVAINTRHRGGALGVGEELLQSTLERRAIMVREAAGDGWAGLELNMLLKGIAVTRDRARAAAELGARLSLTSEQILESAYFLIGEPAAMADQLLRTRERLGFSYITVSQKDIRAFALVLEHLSG